MDTRNKLLRKFFFSYPVEALQIIESLEEEEIQKLFRSLPDSLVSRLLESMDRRKAAHFIQNTNPPEVMEILEMISFGSLESILRKIKSEDRQEFINLLSNEKSVMMGRVLNYQDNTAGACMDPGISAMMLDTKVGAALDSLMKLPDQVLSHVFVVNRDNILTGQVSLKNLISAEKDQVLKAVMDSQVPSVSAEMSVNSLADPRLWPVNFYQLPVVDPTGNFLGGLNREVLYETSGIGKSSNRGALEAGSALGDLYKIGLSGVFKSTSELI